MLRISFERVAEHAHPLAFKCGGRRREDISRRGSPAENALAYVSGGTSIGAKRLSLPNEPELRPPTLHDLLTRAWRVDIDDWMLSPYLTLLEDGEVAGDYVADAATWTFDDGQLLFHDDAGRTTVKMDRISLGSGRAKLMARRENGGQISMTEVDRIGRLSTASPDLHLVRNRCGPKRRNLMVLRAGASAFHPNWTQDVTERDRSWDLCVSVYEGDVPAFPSPFPEYHVEQRRERKFDALYNLFHEESELWDYEYFTFPDDDLWMLFSDVNRLFSICRRYGLEIAQPSLTPDSYVSYHETVQKTGYLLHYVSQIEPMMPVFSRDALRRCIPTYALQRNGYGIHYAWLKTLGQARHRTAIVDAVAVVHTRPVGVNYDRDADMLEGEQIQAIFGKGGYYQIRELGSIKADKF